LEALIVTESPSSSLFTVISKSSLQNRLNGNLKNNTNLIYC
jgi:hypothetical protein